MATWTLPRLGVKFGPSSFFFFFWVIENMYLDIKKFKKKKEKLIESQKGSMDKFVISNKQNITQNLDENITNEQEIHQKELEDNEMIQLQDNNNVQFCNKNIK